MDRVYKGLCLYYQTIFPNSKCGIQDLKLIGNGMESQVYFYKMQKDSTSEPRVLRLFQNSPAIPASERARREYLGLCWLHRQGYPVPKVYDMVDDESYLGSGFIIFEYIDGVPLWSYLNKASEEERVRLSAESIKLFVELHSLPYQDFPEQPTGNVIDVELNIITSYLERFQKHGFAKAVEYLRKRSASINPQPAVTHGDFHFDNILLRPNGQLCIIDWTMVGVNDYRVDIGWSLALMGTDRNLRDAVVRLYEQLSGKPIADLEFFEAYGALRRLGLFAIVLQDGPEAMGLKPGADVRIKQYMGGHLRGLYQTWVDTTGLQLPEIKQYFDGLLD